MHPNKSTTTTWPRLPRVGDPANGISKETYDDLVRYTKYASGAYQILCPRPMGNTLVGKLHNVLTSTQGFIVRDDKRKELVIAFAGTKDTTTILIDVSVVLIPLRGTGLPPHDPPVRTPEDAKLPRVHTGSLLAYESIAYTMFQALEPQIEAHPTYRVVVTGHSLGGAIASIASVAIQYSYQDTVVNLYTFGQPRTGDLAYASLVENMIGIDNVYRGVHLIDGVPTMIPTVLGYQHHGTEFWQFSEPPAPERVKRCRDREDPQGSASIPSSGVNPAHWIYFGQPMALDPSVCW